MRDMYIRLENSEDDECSVLVMCDNQYECREDQSIMGSRWETPSDMIGGYAYIQDQPDLIKQLEDDGYIVNADDYCPCDAVAN